MNGVKKHVNWGLPSKIFMYLWCGFSLFSFLWIVVTSFKTNKEFFASVWGMFQSPQIGNYIKVWTNYNLGRFFFNSVFVVGISVAAILAVSAPAAYVLSRIPFRWRDTISKGFIFGMGVPYQLLLVPLFFILFKIRLIDNLLGLILVYTALSLPFTVFLMMGFFRSLPHQLEEASFIDGCGPIKTFFKIMLPLGQPAIITSGIFNFIWLWNEFLLALTLINDSEKYTLSLGLYGLQGSMQYTGDWVSLFAGFVTVVIPTLVIYLFLSRRIIEGLTLGAVKE